MEVVDIKKVYSNEPLAEQEKDADLFLPIQKLRTRMQKPDIEKLRSKRIWMINSTASGGGVAELIPRLITTLREFNITIEWLTISSFDTPEFFLITKKLHNFIHGKNPAEVTPGFSEKEKKIFEEINFRNAQSFLDNYLKGGDIVVIHDPQPIAMISEIRKKFTAVEVPCVWRCHIGSETETHETKAAWNFLKDYVKQYEYSIFSAQEYIPDFAPNPRVIHPSIHPSDLKNKYLSFADTKSILAKCGLVCVDRKYLEESEKFKNRVQVFTCKGCNKMVPNEDGACEIFALLDRPLIFQVSRWDKLKGFTQLIDAYTDLKLNPEKYIGKDSLDSKEHFRYVNRMGLVLAGPDASKITDDPEGLQVIIDIMDKVCSLPDEIRESVLILSLPMNSRDQNSLIVNALRTISEIIVQNSIKEGFGLTLAEAMWKQKACIATDAIGLQQQLRNNCEGLLVHDPSNPDNLAKALSEMIKKGEKERKIFGQNAKKRVIDNFLVYTHVIKYCDLFKDIIQ